MRRASAGWIAAVGCLAVVASAGAIPHPAPEAPPPDLFPGPPEEFREPAAAPALPSPSLGEPFAIGEALYDPARVGDAVVSLLDRMGVAVVASQEAADGAARLTLSEAEVRTLIALGRADAAAAAANDEGAFPRTFADLHAMVAPLVGGLDVAELAARYARAYERRPDALAPAVLMGQPISPEMTLSRVHLWLLLVDGFVPPQGGGARQALLGGREDVTGVRTAVWRSTDEPPRPRLASAGAPGWGVAASELPALQDPSGGWPAWKLEWMVAHLLVVGSRIPFSLTPAAAATHEGHGGPGQRLTLEARLGSAPEILAGPMGPILVRRSAQLAGCAVDWEIPPDDLATLQAHGTVQANLGAPARTDAGGAVRISYVPQKEAANGVGAQATETARVHASIVIAELLSCAYDLPANARFAGPMLMAGIREATTPVQIGWHSNGLELRLTNSYDVGLDFGPLGNTRRWGFEGVRGSLARMADGSYRGPVRARTSSQGVSQGLGKRCPEAESGGTQWMLATARPVGRLNANQDAARFAVRSGTPDGGYFQLSFKPLTAPAWGPRDACQDSDELLFRTCEGCLRYLPFNDARWTTPEHAFVIAIPRQGKLVYDDRSLADIAPPADLGPFQALIKGTWTQTTIEVERTDEP